MSFIEILVKGLLRKSVIVHKEKISKSVYHIRIQCKSLKKVTYKPGYFIQVFCGISKDRASREKNRSYSVWNFNRPDQTIDIAVDTHSGGPGANWAKLCRTGDAVYIRWQKSKFVIDHTGDHYLLIGDLSTLAHFYEISRHLPADKNVDSFIYSGSHSDLFPDIDGRIPLNFHELPANPTDAIIEKLSAFFLRPTDKHIAYVAGDSRICLSVNQHFRQEIQKDKEQIKLKPFWNPIVRGLD
ncbi:MAG TPA: siderophore-interacting protein [Puia sp.]|nr:siderophore-interacting protein [Puia sp.]